MSMEPKFLAASVASAIGITHGALNSWAHSGYLETLDAAKTTSGKARLFTKFDMLRLSLMAELANTGISLEHSASIMKSQGVANRLSSLMNNKTHPVYLLVTFPIYMDPVSANIYESSFELGQAIENWSKNTSNSAKLPMVVLDLSSLVHRMEVAVSLFMPHAVF